MPIKLHLAYKNIRRLRDIISVFVKHGFHPFMKKLRLTGLVSVPLRLRGGRIAREQELSTPVRVRLAMEELGPSFIKLGQILSTRPDIIPDEYLTEFLKLQDEVPPVSHRDAVRVIEAEFKRPVGELFSHIEQKPMAAASIAQVYRATTVSGEEVVIKVQRPRIAEIIETDIAVLGYLARVLLRYVPETRLYDPIGMVDEFSRVIKRELDFTLEASYTEKFRNNFGGDPRVKIPKVYWGLTTKRVLTMERVEGIKADKADALRDKGIDTEKVAHLVADVFFRQVFEFGLFHGDLHSGNIFVVNENRIALVDFGIVGRLDDAMRHHLADILVCFVTDDFEKLTKVYLKMGILPEEIDRASFQREYYDIMLHYFGRPFKHVRIGELMMDYVRLAARHNVRLPRELLLFDKCLIELEGLARLLYPGADILAESEPYATKLIKERLNPVNAAKEGVDTVADYAELARILPAEAAQILKKLRQDKFRIEFMHRGLEDFMGEMDRSSNRLTFAVIIGALIVGSSMVIASQSTPLAMGYPSLGVLGFVTASFLGVWLAIQILRSGKF